MRRFELVDGKSEKFWEIGRDGADVTVRFGRMGTAEVLADLTELTS